MVTKKLVIDVSDTQLDISKLSKVLDLNLVD